jgi:hypothetical protein
MRPQTQHRHRQDIACRSPSSSPRTTTTAHRTQLTTKLPTTVPHELLYPAHPTHLATDLVATAQQYSPAPPCAPALRVSSAPALRVRSAPALRVDSAPALRVDSPSPPNLPSIFNNTPTPQPQPLLVVTRQRSPSRRTVDYSSKASTAYRTLA